MNNPDREIHFVGKRRRLAHTAEEFQKGFRSVTGCDVRVALTEKQLRSGKVGRNDPCLCGSGKKFKKCCLIGNRESKQWK